MNAGWVTGVSRRGQRRSRSAISVLQRLACLVGIPPLFLETHCGLLLPNYSQVCSVACHAVGWLVGRLSSCHLAVAVNARNYLELEQGLHVGLSTGLRRQGLMRQRFSQ